MTWSRIPMLALALLHSLFAGFTALVGAFADAGDVWQRLLVVVAHPLGATAVLLLVLRRRLAGRTILAAVALLAVVVLADLRMAQLIAVGEARGDWSLALTFSAVPALGIVYGLALLRSNRTTRG